MPSSCPAARRSRARSWTAGRTGPSRAAPAAWRTCWSAPTASSADPTAKNLSEAEQAGLAAHVGAGPGDAVFFAAGETTPSQALLGAARLEIGRRGGLIDENEWSFLWVVDAPLFEPSARARASGDVAVGAGAWTAVHHAFTSPKPEWVDRFEESPGEALAYAYDIVCNGNEIGGGSIRIHRRDVQERVFAVMGLTAGAGAGEVRLPARRVRLRRTAARRHRVRLGPDLRRCSPGPTRSATSSRSPRAAAASTR